MNNMSNNTIYLLTKEEVSFIAGAMGIQQLYGIFSLDSTPDETELYNILKNLIEKEFIKCGENSFIISKEIKDIISLMNEAEEYRVYKTRGNTLPVKCIYKKDDRVLICEQSFVNENEVKFMIIPKSELNTLLNEEGYAENEEVKTDDIN